MQQNPRWPIVVPGPTCPHCQFTTRAAGRAARRRDGSFACADCGCTWREIGPTDPDRVFEAGRRHDLSAPSACPPPEGLPQQRPVLPAIAVVVSLIAVIAAIGAVLHVGQLLPGDPRTVELTVTRAQQFNRDGRIAVMVEGRIDNRSRSDVPVEPIEIVLAQGQGHRFYRWRFNPAVRMLRPGGSLRFSTADGNVPQLASTVEIGHGGARVASPL